MFLLHIISHDYVISIFAFKLDMTSGRRNYLITGDCVAQSQLPSLSTLSNGVVSLFSCLYFLTLWKRCFLILCLVGFSVFPLFIMFSYKYPCNVCLQIRRLFDIFCYATMVQLYATLEVLSRLCICITDFVV